MTKIKEFTFGDKAVLVLRFSDIQIRKTTSNADYASFIGFDGTDLVECKIWSLSEDKKDLLKNGEIYSASGTMKDYQGKMQFNISDFKLIDEDDDIDISGFYEYAKIDAKNLQNLILGYVEKIENKILKQIVINLLKKNFKEYFMHPAAVVMHHNYFSGLAYHVYSMLKLSNSFMELYPFVNRDLVYAGIILHDIGKIDELTGPKGIEYTLEGNLIGHITISSNKIYHEACLLGYENTDEVKSLIHVILAHHGLMEYGSPKTPQMAEAVLIHLLDLSDSRMAALEKEITSTEKGNFTNPINAFERKSFYVPNFTDDKDKQN